MHNKKECIGTETVRNMTTATIEDALAPAKRARKPLYKLLYVQVLFAIVLGAAVGWLYPEFATQDGVKALGDGFIKLIKMVIAPIIFCTVVSGISHMQDAKKVGRVGVKALVYFEVVSTFALAGDRSDHREHRPARRGLGGRPMKPQSQSMPIQPRIRTRSISSSISFRIASLAHSPRAMCCRCFCLRSFSASRSWRWATGAPEWGSLIDEVAHAIFGVIAIVMKVAPLGAFGAMAYTIGKYGPTVFGNLVSLIAVFYLTSALFVIVVLGTIARFAGVNIFKFLYYIKDELLVVLGTSSSESALPQLMEKLQRLGCSKSVVGLVVPTGYSFNLDGTNIYMTLRDPFHRASAWGRSHFRAAVDDPSGGDADVEGRKRSYGGGLCHLGGDASRRRSPACAWHGNPAWHRQVHERVPGFDKHHRQWRGDNCGLPMGE